MPYLSLSDGVPIHYTDLGSGRPLILMHALTFDADYFWQKNLPELAKHCRVIAFDYRGHGLSGKPNHGYSIERYAEDLAELIEQLDLHDVVLGGFSLGGFTALTYIKNHGSDRVGGLVLMEMTPRLPSAPGWEHPTFGEFPEEAALGYGDALRADRSIYNDFFNAAFLEPPTGDALDEMIAHTYLTPTDAAAEIMTDMAKQDWRDYLPGIELPTGLIYAYPNNNILPTKLGQWMHETIPNSKLELFEHSSHSPFWEEPEHFNAVLSRFVTG